ncbi:MAG: hypothetical protein KDA21_06760 [Phycisphaerales bacterium]|nr:hypothetical protein [Phycisphaerales bacterium]
MLWLTPRDVTLGGEPLAGVEAVVMDRRAEELVVEHGEDGPHVVFADVVRQTVHVRVLRRPGPESGFEAVPGAEHGLRFRTAPSASDARGRVVTALVVITGVTTEARPGRAAMETIQAIAVAPDGTTDPVVITRG